MSPFDDEKVAAYLHKRFPLDGDHDNAERQTRSVDILKKSGSLRFRPFLLSHIEDLLNSNRTEWDELTTYDELVSVWLRREVRKNADYNFSDRDLFFACMFLAVKMQETGVRHFTSNALKKAIRQVPIFESISHIEYGSKSLLNRTSEGDYRFSHFSIQEFLVSAYIFITSDSSTSDNMVRLARRFPLTKNKIRLTLKTLEFLSMRTCLGWRRGNGFALNDLKLDGFDFSNANWNKTSFDGSSLRDCNFEDSIVSEASFSNCQMQNAIFKGANVEETRFVGSSLSFSEFHEAKCKGAKFSNAVLSGANLRDAADFPIRDKSIVFSQTVLPDGKRKGG